MFGQVASENGRPQYEIVLQWASLFETAARSIKWILYFTLDSQDYRSFPNPCASISARQPLSHLRLTDKSTERDRSLAACADKLAELNTTGICHGFTAKHLVSNEYFAGMRRCYLTVYDANSSNTTCLLGPRHQTELRDIFRQSKAECFGCILGVGPTLPSKFARIMHPHISSYIISCIIPCIISCIIFSCIISCIIMHHICMIITGIVLHCRDLIFPSLKFTRIQLLPPGVGKPCACKAVLCCLADASACRGLDYPTIPAWIGLNGCSMLEFQPWLQSPSN